MYIGGTVNIGHILAALALSAATGLIPLETATAVPGAEYQARSGTDWVDTGKTCDWNTYNSHYTIEVAQVAVVLTHETGWAIPPSGSHVETKWSAHRTTVRASVAWGTGSSVEASAAAKILVKASVSTHLDLKAAGSHTAEGGVKVTDTVSNPTRQNATFPFFKGTKKAHGRYRYYFCEEVSSPTFPRPKHVFYRPGKWRSYVGESAGAIRCGAGSTNLDAVARLAYRVGCA
jgi:hypothetical protein